MKAWIATASNKIYLMMQTSLLIEIIYLIFNLCCLTAEQTPPFLISAPLYFELVEKRLYRWQANPAILSCLCMMVQGVFLDPKCGGFGLWVIRYVADGSGPVAGDTGLTDFGWCSPFVFRSGILFLTVNLTSLFYSFITREHTVIYFIYSIYYIHLQTHKTPIFFFLFFSWHTITNLTLKTTLIR